MGCRGVKVASCEASKSTVSKSGIAFLLKNVLNVEPKLFDTVLVLVLEAQVEKL